MNLNVYERFQLLSILPKKNDLIGIKLTQSIIQKTESTLEEIEQIEYVVNQNGTISFNKKKAVELVKEILYEPAEIELIKKALKELDNKKEVNIDLLTLFEQFKP